MCDASYNFTVLVIGAAMVEFFQVHKTLDFPTAKEIDSTSGSIPYYIVADEALSLLENLVWPCQNTTRQYKTRPVVWFSIFSPNRIQKPNSLVIIHYYVQWNTHYFSFDQTFFFF